VDASDCRKKAEECVRVAQNARPHHRAMLLLIAGQWLELSAYDEWTQTLFAAITAVSDFAAASLSAAARPMKPKPYESNHMPAITPAAPVHRQGLTTCQLILIVRSSGLKRTRADRAESEQNCSLQRHRAPPARQGSRDCETAALVCLERLGRLAVQKVRFAACFTWDSLCFI
jgi:hypothetical protein